MANDRYSPDHCNRCGKLWCMCSLPQPETPVPDPKTETPARRGLDPELQAVAKIDRILADLDPLTALRVLDYLSGKSRSRMDDRSPADDNGLLRPIPGFGPGVGESGDR